MILVFIATGPYAPTLTPEATTFCQQELLEWAQSGFSIILPVDVALFVFGDCIRISCLVSVDPAKRKPRLLYNVSAAPDDVTPAVNASIKKSTAPNTMQFGACLSRFLQKTWESDPSDGPAWLSKWDISDAFHRCLIRPGDISAFTYVFTPLPTDIPTPLCIDFILPMGWDTSPDIFCVASDTVSDVSNGCLLNPNSAFNIYPPIAGTYYLYSSLTDFAARLQYMDVYIDDLNYAT